MTIFLIGFSEDYFFLYPAEYIQTQNIVKINLENYTSVKEKPNLYIYDGGNKKKLPVYQTINGDFYFNVNLNMFQGNSYSFLVTAENNRGEYISQFFPSFLEKDSFSGDIRFEITTSITENGYEYYFDYSPTKKFTLINIQFRDKDFKEEEFLEFLKEIENGFHEFVVIFHNEYGIPFEKKVKFLKLDELVTTENMLKPKQVYEISTYHIVQKGESLYKISEMYNVLPGDLVNINNLKDPSLIYPGQPLKIGKVEYGESPLRLEIDLSNNKMYLYFHDTIIKNYIVAVGMSDHTPPGYYRISYKEKDPALYWYDEYIPPGSLMNGMGTRWLQLSNPQYGIHGTTKPWEIGKRISHGCIRMFNFDVEEIDFLVSLGTEVYVYN